MQQTLYNSSSNFSIADGSSKLFATNAQLINNGIVTDYSNDLVDLQSGSSFSNKLNGTYNFTTDGGISASSGGAAFNNDGLLEKSAGSGVSVIGSGVTFANTGTVEVNSGTLSFRGGGSISGGTLYATSGGTLDFSSIGDGSNLLVSAGYIYGDTNSTVTFNLTGTSQTTFAGGIIGGQGATVNEGNFAWTGGVINGSGGLVNTGQMAIGGSDAKYIGNGGVLTNFGIITQTSSNNVNFEGTSRPASVINNQAGGIYNLETDSGLNVTNPSGYGYGTFNNQGTFEKTGGTGTSGVDGNITFNNTGTVEVDSGTLSIVGSVSQQLGNSLTGGTWNVNANSTLSFASGGNITTSQAKVTLSGANSNFTNFAYVNNNQGIFNLSDGRIFTTAGDLTNSGRVTIDKPSRLNVTGNFIQTATGSLIGEGTLAGTANISGIIEAGNAGLTINGDLTLNSDATLKFDLGSIAVQGDLTLDNASFTLNSALGSTSLASGTQLTLLTYTGTETGFFDYNGVALQTGSVFDFGVNKFQINYAFGDPSITLTAESAPEPSTYGMLCIGLILLAIARRSNSFVQIILGDRHCAG